jgi:hypothetical protein
VVAGGDVLQDDFSPATDGKFYCKFTSGSTSVRVAIARFNGAGSDLNGYGNVK